MFSISRRTSCSTPSTIGVGDFGEPPVSRADDTLATIVASGWVSAGSVCVDGACVAAGTFGTEIGAAIAVEGDGVGDVGAALMGGTSAGVAVVAWSVAVRGVGRTRVGESGTRAAVTFFGMPEITAGGEPGSPPVVCRSPLCPLH